MTAPEMTDDHGILKAARKSFKKHTKRLEQRIRRSEGAVGHPVVGVEVEQREKETLASGLGQFSDDPKKRSRAKARFREITGGY